jgi:hypothetical protein
MTRQIMIEDQRIVRQLRQWAVRALALSIVAGAGYGCGSALEAGDDSKVETVSSDLRGASISLEHLDTSVRDGVIVTDLLVNGVRYEVFSTGPDSNEESVVMTSRDGKLRFAVGANENKVKVSWSGPGGEAGEMHRTIVSARPHVNLEGLVRAATSSSMAPHDVELFNLYLPVMFTVTEWWRAEQLGPDLMPARTAVEALGAALLSENQVSSPSPSGCACSKPCTGASEGSCRGTCTSCECSYGGASPTCACQ